MKPLKKVLFALSLFTFAVTLRTGLPDVNQHDLRWLALNIYYEAGNQPALGKIAVGIVTINRVNHHELFGDTVESVVKQHKQFSWYNSKKVDVPKSNDAWKDSVNIARYVLKLPQNHAIIEHFRGITHFHATYVRPKWKNSMIKVTQIGDHIFYRMKEKQQ